MDRTYLCCVLFMCFQDYQKWLIHRTKWNFLKHWFCYWGSSEDQQNVSGIPAVLKPIDHRL